MSIGNSTALENNEKAKLQYDKKFFVKSVLLIRKFFHILVVTVITKASHVVCSDVINCSEKMFFITDLKI